MLLANEMVPELCELCDPSENTAGSGSGSGSGPSTPGASMDSDRHDGTAAGAGGGASESTADKRTVDAVVRLFTRLVPLPSRTVWRKKEPELPLWPVVIVGICKRFHSVLRKT